MINGKYLITADNWFVAPDGNQYKSAWGECKILGDDILQIKTNRHSTNWFLKIGSDKKHIIIAGCQIHYAIKCEKKPYTKYGETWTTDKGEINTYKTPTQIYIAE